MMPQDVTLNEFGRRWFLDQGSHWTPARRAAIRRAGIDTVMPSLGKLPLSQLRPEGVDAWLTERVVRGRSAGLLFAASVLLEILTAAADTGMLDPAQYDALCARLAPTRVTALRLRHQTTSLKRRRGWVPTAEPEDAYASQVRNH